MSARVEKGISAFRAVRLRGQVVGKNTRRGRSGAGTLDAYEPAPAEHSMSVIAIDHLGNFRSAKKTFRVRSISQSLIGNLDAVAQKGLVRQGIHTSLRAKLEAAVASHARGQHSTEHAQLRALLSEPAQSRRGIDAATAQRLTTFIEHDIET